ncbi:MAG: hypothetical protein EAZ32_15840 [Cytophagia bacterium]|jgi:hypothetical protein|nr:MAG: hypothetical protein EAY79_04660 [Runella slithyformis]TAG17695.1 MAG: hypothetical protein EAZ38_16835 [Cytophagales bacterium]TAG37309.1 MAG: hypothetical protein EAZ32_15840 [Cytophagia bacterium]TAG78275.1 MAG: hypothetical protein EAZ22_13905 [Cytophagales bacterium]
MKSFSQITRADLENEFGINIIKARFLPIVEPILVPVWLVNFLKNRMASLTIMRTEKAISEALIAPMLMALQEMHPDKITVYSGEPLATDKLSGICDFLITKDPNSFDPKGGYLVLVEAKKNDLLSGVPQCVAEMYAAQVLNKNDDPVYGCVSTGLEWLFIKLENKIATTHSNIFTISEVGIILGIFGWIIDQK